MADSATPIRARKRVSNSEGWDRKKRKTGRNQGKEYFTENKAGEQRKVKAKRMGDDCRCPLKCFDKVSEVGRFSILSGFGEMGDWNAQNAYLCGSIKTTEVQKRYGKKDNSRRNFTRHYYVNFAGVSIRVCKKAFLARPL